MGGFIRLRVRKPAYTNLNACEGYEHCEDCEHYEDREDCEDCEDCDNLYILFCSVDEEEALGRFFSIAEVVELADVLRFPSVLISLLDKEEAVGKAVIFLPKWRNWHTHYVPPGPYLKDKEEAVGKAVFFMPKWRNWQTRYVPQVLIRRIRKRRWARIFLLAEVAELADALRSRRSLSEG